MVRQSAFFENLLLPLFLAEWRYVCKTDSQSKAIEKPPIVRVLQKR
jgi:hypothetical protein